ncbi:LicD family protein [Bacteroides congonensis]
MKTINLAELKVIQMDVLEVIDKFCTENNMHYSLACGSFLGAIRHKGYIPWDDDIDIYMPREDYERFIRIFPEELNHIKVASMERESKWNRAYAQAYDNRTIMNEYAKTPINVGVYIDVYPLDSVPDSDVEWIRYNKLRRTLIRTYELKYIPIRWDRSILRNIVLILGKTLLLPFNSRQMAKFISRFAQRYNGKGYNRSFECVQGMLQKYPFQSSLMTEFTRTQFEDRQFIIMKDYDAYLSNGYGNYMQLPPKEKQVPHHQFKAYWKD